MMPGGGQPASTSHASDLLLPRRRARATTGLLRAVPDLEPRPRGRDPSPARLAHPPERQVLHHLPGGRAPRDGTRAARILLARLGAGADRDRALAARPGDRG